MTELSNKERETVYVVYKDTDVGCYPYHSEVAIYATRAEAEGHLREYVEFQFGKSGFLRDYQMPATLEEQVQMLEDKLVSFRWAIVPIEIGAGGSLMESGEIDGDKIYLEGEELK